MDAPRVPVHRSLIVRLLATSLTIAVVAIVATSWLASQYTSQTINQQLGRSLSDDKSVYDELLGYAATHPDWSAVGPVIAARAAKLNRRITLTTVTRQLIADTATGPPPATTARPSATVDPLAVDPGLTGRTDRIDPRVVGPYRSIGYLATALNDLADRRERSERQRRAMVDDVAHELRNPLTNIRSWLEAVQDGLATADGPLVTRLHDETVHLQHIVDDLRDLAAADAGTLRMHPEPMPVTDAIELVVEAHRPNATAAGVVLATDFAGDPEVVADPVRLRQLVGNLLSNAIRHSRPGGTVTVRAGVTGGRLEIAVADTGAGIAAEDLPRVFDRFWRADESRDRTTGGSGLGLSIARQIAEAHGGGLTVASTPGAGATFTAAWPAIWPRTA